MTRPEDEMLETYFQAARAAPPEVPDALLRRIEMDALAAQPSASLPGRLWAAIGGFAGFGGMVTATLAGVWIGVVGVEPVVAPVETLLGVSAVENADLFGFGWEELEGTDG